MMRMSAILALMAAVALAVVKALLAEQLWWPFVVSDYAVAAALAFGAISALRGGQGRLLAAAWAGTLGLSWSTFFHHLAERETLEKLTLVDVGLGLLLTAAIVGCIQCIAGEALCLLPGATPKSSEQEYDVV